MATRSGMKTETSEAPAQPGAAELQLARQVHTLAQVLYGRMASGCPGMAPRAPVLPGIGFHPFLSAPPTVAGPAYFPWMVGMPAPGLPYTGVF